MSSFKVGNIVRLNSGGPKMQVIEILVEENQEIANCAWDTDGGVIYEDFYPSMLTLVKE